jgi:hypothetical protein
MWRFTVIVYCESFLSSEESMVRKRQQLESAYSEAAMYLELD